MRREDMLMRAWLVDRGNSVVVERSWTKNSDRFGGVPSNSTSISH